MGQTGWRLPDDLLKRVRVHCAQTGERQNEFVRQALEKALGDEQGTSPLMKGQRTPEVAPRRSAPPRASAAPLGKGFVPPRPKGT